METPPIQQRPAIPAARPEASNWYDHVNAEHFNKVIDAYTQSRKSDGKKEMVSLVFFYAFAIIIILATCFLGWLKVIDSCSTGTVIAAVVGYVFGKKSD